MKFFECPVAAQDYYSVSKLTNELVEIPTDEERERYFLDGEDDRFARIGCSLGNCSVRAIASIKTGGLRVATFYTENPSECVRTEAEREAIEAVIPNPYLQPVRSLESSQPIIDSSKGAAQSRIRALISRLIT